MNRMHELPPQTGDLPPPEPETPSIRALKKCLEAMREENLDLNQCFGIAAVLVRNLVALGTVGGDGAESSNDLVRLFMHKLGAALPGTLRTMRAPAPAPIGQKPKKKLKNPRLRLGGN
jgi:hypothetical protein